MSGIYTFISTLHEKNSPVFTFVTISVFVDGRRGLSRFKKFLKFGDYVVFTGQ